ncbi:MAG: MMPL family transporter [Candidatus Pacearchaeota archaeon]|nr:MMPL family transporter [Candidatus Pacearchaeota archaeon]
MKFLESLARLQINNTKNMLVVIGIFTIFLGFGLFNISMQSDMDKMMPQDLEIFRIADRIQDNFGGQDSSIILIKVNGVEKGGVYDIRDPAILKFLIEIQGVLENEELVESVQSVGMFLDKDKLPTSLGESVNIFSSVPVSDDFFSKDYSATIIMISSDLGGGEKKIKELENLIQEKVNEVSKPDGIEIYITGTPQIRAMILDLLVSDAVYTISVAALIIFLLLIFIQRSFSKSVVISIPLILGIIWTLGAMGWLGIELSIITVGIGAMILGLGVEYGIFIVSRYGEERVKNSSEESLKIAVRDVGSSVLGSGMTTVTGFLALTFSIMPMMRDLGLSLAMGITFSLMSAIVVNPLMIILEEKFLLWNFNLQDKKIKEKLNEKK